MSMSADEEAKIVSPKEGIVCIVDGDGNYNVAEKELKALIELVDPQETREYSIVGIMGCQSTGKSTLLNLLFGSDFKVMDQQVRRGQTTKGVWLEVARNTTNLAVMDLEGTDSGERGEDRTTFERQTVLYGLSLCEILIVNLWEHDIGRYTASNYGVMKTVFEVNLQLFKGQVKTMLLFVIRDHVDEGNESILTEKLTVEMGKIWEELRKPDELAAMKMLDLFDFRFCFLPHMKLQKDEFKAGVDELRTKFVDKSHKDHFFATSYHGKKAVPADGFATYAYNVWNTIKSNKDLDLPTQREMLASYRCDELSQVALQQFGKQLVPFQEECKERFIADFGGQCEQMLGQIVTAFDKSAERYAPAIVAKKREELVEKLGELVQSLLGSQMVHILAKVEKTFEQALKAKLSDEVFEKDFLNICDMIKAAELSLFADLKKNTQIPSVDFSFASAERELESALANVVQAQRFRQVELYAAGTDAQLQTVLAEKSTAVFKQAGKEMWEQLGKAVSAVLDVVVAFEDASAPASTAACADGLLGVAAFSALFACSEEEKEELNARFIRSSMRFMREKAGDVSRNLPTLMRLRFEMLFKKDKEGVPRKWDSSVNVRRLFKSCRREALKMLRLFKHFKLPRFMDKKYQPLKLVLQRFPSLQATEDDLQQDSGVALRTSAGAAKKAATAKAAKVAAAADKGGDTADDDEESEDGADSEEEDESLTRDLAVLVTSAQKFEYERQFHIEIEGALFEAQSEQERVLRETNTVPTWLIVLLVYFGYDDILSLLRSPLTLAFVVIAALAAAVVHKLNMWGPVMSATKATVALVYDQLNTLVQGNLKKLVEGNMASMSGGGGSATSERPKTAPASTASPSKLRSKKFD